MVGQIASSVRRGIGIVLLSVGLLLAIGACRRGAVPAEGYVEEDVLGPKVPRSFRDVQSHAVGEPYYLTRDFATIAEVERSTGDCYNAAELFKARYRLAAQARDTVEMERDLAAIAICYIRLGENDIAEKYLNKSGLLFDSSQQTLGALAVQQACGLLYDRGGWDFVAQLYYEDALGKAERLGNQTAIVISRMLLANVLLRSGSLVEAKELLGQCQGWFDTTSREELVMHWNVAQARLLAAQGDSAQARRHFRDGEHWAKQHGMYTDWLSILGEKAAMLARAGDSLHAYSCALRAVRGQDSLQDKHWQQSFELAAMGAEYEDAVQRLSEYIQGHRGEFGGKERYIVARLLALIFLLFSLAALGVGLRERWRRRVLRQQQHLLEDRAEALREEKLRLDSQGEKQVAELQAQKQRVDKVRQLVLADTSQLTQSIEYTTMIQRTVQPAEADLATYFPEYFLIARPKEFVSGDMPWFAQIGEEAFVGMIDSSGTGVASASLSVMAYVLLNEVALQEENPSPKRLVIAVKHRLCQLFQQTEASFREEMSMKIVVLSVNRHTLSARYAGLGNPLFYSLGDGRVEHVQGYEEIGGITDEAPGEIEEIQIPITPQTTFYLSTDGYYCQLNPLHKSLGIEGFKALLEEILALPLAEQKRELVNRLSRYRVAVKQTDDVTMVGVSLRAPED